jgi:HlyD family secretion protein
MRPMMKSMAWFVILVVLGGVGGVMYMSTNAATSNDPPVTVTFGSVKRYVRGTGRVEGVGETPLSFPFTGQIENVYFREGQEVSAGQTLADLNTAHMEKQIDQFKAKLKEAEAYLDLVKTPASEDLIRQHEEKVKQAELTIKAAKAKLDSLNVPLEPIRTPRWQIDDAEREVKERTLLLEQAQLDLKRLLDYSDDTARRAADENVNVAQAEYDKVNLDVNLNKGKTIFLQEKKTPEEMQANLNKALASLNHAKAERDLALRPPRKEDIEAQRLKVKLAETALEGSTAKLKRLSVEEPAPKVSEFDIKQAEYGVAQSEAAKREAEAKLDEARRGPDPAKARAAEAAVERAQKELEAAKLNKDGLVIRAPRDGMITKCIAEPGMLASAFTPMFYIVDFSQKRVRAEFDISRLTELKKDLPVIVTSRALGREILDGRVLEIGRVGTRRLTLDDPSAPKGGDVVEVIIALDVPTDTSKKATYESLRPNVPAEVEVQLERRDRVLVIPRSYVSNVNGQEVVQLLPRTDGGKNEAPVMHPVETGLKDETYVEIISGLKEGDRVMKPVAQGR